MLKIEQLQFAYGDERVLKGVSLEIEPGRIHGILGVNGAGKTTLFRTIYGFQRPQSGWLTFEGKPMKKGAIAMLETHPFFYSYMKGKEYLDIVSAGKEEFFPLDKWNAIFQLPLNDLIDTYSTGMKKKLAFLGVLALDRPIMILDEPFSGVDVESNEKIYQILTRLRDAGKVIILSSHILESFTEVCDEISLLRGGIIERSYQQIEFPELGRQLKAEVKQTIGKTLDELF